MSRNDKIDEEKWEKTVNQLIDEIIKLYGFEGGLEHLENFGKVDSQERKQKMIKMYKSRML